MDTTAHAMVRELRQNSPHLSYWDLEPGQRVTVKIKAVERQTNVATPRGKEPVVYFLRFDGAKKLLWLTTGKIKTLKTILGNDASKWSGQSVTLFADPTVKMKGVEVGGIVIEKGK